MPISRNIIGRPNATSLKEVSHDKLLLRPAHVALPYITAGGTAVIKCGPVTPVTTAPPDDSATKLGIHHPMREVVSSYRLRGISTSHLFHDGRHSRGDGRESNQVIFC